jgi:hypothetical protein
LALIRDSDNKSLKRAEDKLDAFKARVAPYALSRKMIGLKYAEANIEIELLVNGEGEVVRVNPIFRTLLYKKFDAFMEYLKANYSNVRVISE